MTDSLPESLPRVTEPISAPTTLENLITEYNVQVGQNEFAICALLLKDALGYFVRYYAALSVAACRELDCLPGEIAQAWENTPRVDQAVPALEACLEKLRPRQDRLARKLVGVFFEPGEISRSFTKHLFDSDSTPEFRLATFCNLSREYVQKVDRGSLAQAAHLLDAWVSASFGFFLDSEQRLETGAYFGQLEQVVQFDQYTLRTGLTMRVQESRAQGSGAAMLAPEFVPLAPASSLIGQAPAPEAPVEDVPTVEEVTPEASPAEPPPVRASLNQDQLQAAEALKRAVQHSQKTRASTAPAEVRSAPAAKTAEVGVSRVNIRIEPLGFVSNKRGRLGYGGFLWVDSTDEEPIQGVVSATSGEVELTPSFFEGTSNRVVYWADPDSVSSGGNYIQVKAAGEERLYSFWKLAPPSRFENFGLRHQLGLLFLPGVLATSYSCWVLVSGERSIDAQLRQALGQNFERFMDPGAPLSLKQAGVGELDIVIRPKVETGLLVYLLTAWLVPVVVTKLFSRFSRRDQKSLMFPFLLACALPTLVYLGLWTAPVMQSVVCRHPELYLMDFRRSFFVFAFLNVVTTVYEVASLGSLFHRFLNELGRIALAGLLALLALALILVSAYGSSWFG